MTSSTSRAANFSTAGQSLDVKPQTRVLKQHKSRHQRREQQLLKGAVRHTPMWPWAWHPDRQKSDGSEDVAGTTQRFLSQNPSLHSVAQYLAEDEDVSDDLDLKLRRQLAGLTLLAGMV